MPRLSAAGPVHPFLCGFSHSDTTFHANNQSTRTQTTQTKKEPEQVACAREMPSKTGCLFASQDDDTEEAELRSA